MPVVPTLNTDSYPTYDELKTYMFGVAEAVPHLVKVYSVGESAQGRGIWLAEVTNQGTGSAADKSAIWIDGNSVGDELCGSVVALSLLQRLASEYGREEQVTDLLDTHTFYILPRMAPDGAEQTVKTGYTWPLSAIGLPRTRANAANENMRAYPMCDSRDSITPADVDGDGRCYQMRIEDPHGQWKASKRDDRLMLQRTLDDKTGPFYRLYREGFLNSDAEQNAPNPQPYANSEVASDFLPSGQTGLCQRLAETRAVSACIAQRSNICLAISLRSSHNSIHVSCPASMPAIDQALLSFLGKNAATFATLPFEQDNDEGSDFCDWLYQAHGIAAIQANAWSLQRFVSLDNKSSADYEGELLSVLRWIDRERNGKGFRPWRPYVHPQLGQLEIGGWDLAETWLNPPTGEPLRDVCSTFVAMTINAAASLPRLALSQINDEIVGWTECDEPKTDPDSLSPLRKISCELTNTGYLPIWVTEAARRQGQPITTQLSTPEKVPILMGEAQTRTTPLAGIITPHLSQHNDPVWFAGATERNRAKLQWLVRGEGEVTVRTTSPRGGTVEFATTQAGQLDLRLGAYVGDANTTSVTHTASKWTNPSTPTAPAVRPGTIASSISSAAHRSASTEIPARSPLGFDGQPTRSPAYPEPSMPTPRPAAFPEPPQPSNAARPSSILSSSRRDAAPNVRPVNLTSSTANATSSGARSLIKESVETERPALPNTSGGLAGYRPSATRNPRPMSTSSSDAVPIRAFQKPPVVDSSASNMREDSPLRKEAPAPIGSGRVFGQTTPREPNLGIPASMNYGNPVPSRQDIEDIPLPDSRNIRPHSLVSGSVSRSGAPLDSAPESHPTVEDGLEGPPSLSRAAAPLLLRRTRDQEDR